MYIYIYIYIYVYISVFKFHLISKFCHKFFGLTLKQVLDDVFNCTRFLNFVVDQVT